MDLYLENRRKRLQNLSKLTEKDSQKWIPSIPDPSDNGEGVPKGGRLELLKGDVEKVEEQLNIPQNVISKSEQKLRDDMEVLGRRTEEAIKRMLRKRLLEESTTTED